MPRGTGTRRRKKRNWDEVVENNGIHRPIKPESERAKIWKVLAELIPDPDTSPLVSSREVMDACEKVGVYYITARQEYSSWLRFHHRGRWKEDQ